jgi:hypothetical protein
VKKLWIVGQVISENGREWEFQGVFSTERKAIAACVKENYFIAPANLNEEFVEESILWVGAYYPKLLTEME